MDPVEAHHLLPETDQDFWTVGVSHYFCAETAIAILFFRSRTWHFRGDVCNSPSYKTTKLQHFEIDIAACAVPHYMVLPCTKIRSCVSDKLCKLSQGWFSMRHVEWQLFHPCSHSPRSKPSLLWLEATRYLVRYALMEPVLYCTSSMTVILKYQAIMSWFRKAFPIYSVL